MKLFSKSRMVRKAASTDEQAPLRHPDPPVLVRDIGRQQIERLGMTSQSTSPADDAMQEITAELAVSLQKLSALEEKSKEWAARADSAPGSNDAGAYEVITGLLVMLNDAISSHAKTATELHAAMLLIVQLALPTAQSTSSNQGETPWQQ